MTNIETDRQTRIRTGRQTERTDIQTDIDTRQKDTYTNTGTRTHRGQTETTITHRITEHNLGSQ